MAGTSSLVVGLTLHDIVININVTSSMFCVFRGICDG
jgi:hypothetical protein